MTEQTPPTPYEGADILDEQEAAEVEDFDAWRAQQKAKRAGGRRVKVFGQVVTLPSSIPLGLTLTMDTLADSAGLEDVQQVVGVLYGKGALDHWIGAGVDMDDFQVLLAWGVAAASGQNITFDQAAELVADAEAKKAAKQAAKQGKAGKAKKRKR